MAPAGKTEMLQSRFAYYGNMATVFPIFEKQKDKSKILLLVLTITVTFEPEIWPDKDFWPHSFFSIPMQKMLSAHAFGATGSIPLCSCR